LHWRFPAPSAADAPEVARFAKIGLVPGKDFDPSKLNADFVKRIPQVAFDRIMLAQSGHHGRADPFGGKADYLGHQTGGLFLSSSGRQPRRACLCDECHSTINSFLLCCDCAPPSPAVRFPP
jgi:hypothetical protein